MTTTKTIKEQIIEWAKANYDKSYAAQCVVEGCYDDDWFAKFSSMKDFMGHVEIQDDRYEDIRATVF